jgi:cell division transport system ATP-binding protein
MITFQQVSRRHGERLVLDSVSWRMEEGECVVFLGDSGAGKTTVLRLITHEVQPTSGNVTVGTFRGGKLSRGQRALLRRTLGIIYEDFRLLNDRTVFENIALAVRIMGQSRNDEVIPRVLYALEEVGLQHKQAAFPHELSAGEKQRAAIARAIVNRPAVILADEPTGALEKKSADDILRLLKRIHAEGSALLLATTRADVAQFIGGRILTLEDGRITSGQKSPPRDPSGWSAPAGLGLSEAPVAAPAPALEEPPAASAPHDDAQDDGGEVRSAVDFQAPPAEA